jgi:hypothetical protein
VSVSAAAYERVYLEFQGGLVKVKPTMKPTPTGESGAVDVYQKRYYSRAWSEYVNALPADRVAVVDGQRIAAELADYELAAVERRAFALARAAMDLSKRGVRGAIYTFSRASRKRLLELCARFEAKLKALFLTFTYRQNMQDHVAAKRHLDLLLRWLKRKHSESAILWRMEYQERGAIHFHLLVFDKSFIPASDLTQYWQKITGDDSYPDVELVRSRRKAIAYVSKYLGKLPDQRGQGNGDAPPAAFFSEDGAATALPASDSPALLNDGGTPLGLDHSTYSEISSSTFPADEVAPTFIGRYWGVVNRDKLPFADKVVREYSGSARPFLDFRRYARQFLNAPKRVSNRPALRRRRAFKMRSSPLGFTLFVDDIAGWLRTWDLTSGADNLYSHFSPQELRSARLQTF